MTLDNLKTWEIQAWKTETTVAEKLPQVIWAISKVVWYKTSIYTVFIWKKKNAS